MMVASARSQLNRHEKVAVPGGVFVCWGYGQHRGQMASQAASESVTSEF
jgi:hypothetical protein